MVTTIQISTELQKELTKRKIVDKETYEEIIWDLLEDSMELSEEAKRDIDLSREEIRKGKTITLSQIKKKLRI